MNRNYVDSRRRKCQLPLAQLSAKKKSLQAQCLPTSAEVTHQFFSNNLNAPMASLPVVIFQFALSPYKDWQSLAWTGALIITLTVLVLNIGARALGAERKE